MVFVSLGVTLLSDSGIIALPTATEKAAHMVVENSVQGDGRTISFITTTLWRPFHNSTCISTRVCAIMLLSFYSLRIGQRRLAKHSALRQCLDLTFITSHNRGLDEQWGAEPSNLIPAVRASPPLSSVYANSVRV